NRRFYSSLRPSIGAPVSRSWPYRSPLSMVGGLGHWFSLIGTFLPFAIITYAICLWNIACPDSRLSWMPQATAGTARMVKWTRRTWCPTPATRHSLGPPWVALADLGGLLRPGAHGRRRALKHASA